MVASVTDSSSWVPIRWPDSFPRGLRETSADFGWKTREEDGVASLCLEQRYRRQSVTPLRFTSQSIGPTPISISGLSELHPDGNEQWRSGWTPTEIARLCGSSEPGDHAMAMRYAFISAPQDDLPRLVNEILADSPELTGGTMYEVSVDDQLFYRQPVAASLLAREVSDPNLALRGRTSNDAFRGGHGLDSLNHLGAAVYLLPAVHAMCPTWLGYVATCDAGSCVFFYPQPLEPPTPKPYSLANAQPAWFFTNPRVGLIPDRVSLSDVEAFFEWWIDRWNGVLGQLLDPSTHRGRDGFFDPFLMIGRLSTLERLATCVHAILQETRDNEFARTAILFDAFDLQDDLGGGQGSWDRLTNPGRVDADLDTLRQEFSGKDGVGRVVLPRCESALKALLELRTGFTDSTASQRDQAKTDADIYLLLRAMRNAGHGLGRGLKSRQQVATLLGHQATLSPDLADLAWLHLLRLLCFSHWQT